MAENSDHSDSLDAQESGAREAGVLLHPTSLPGPFGVGDLGGEIVRFLDWARDAGQSLWQVLPLGPPDSHNAPYGCLSAFAGNPLLISPQRLAEDGLLDDADLEGATVPQDEDDPDVHWGKPPRWGETVDFDAAKSRKESLLRRAWERYRQRPEAADELAAFAAAPEQAAWLDDWTLFAALRRREDGRGWWDWPAELRDREPGALDAARRELADEIAYQTWVQRTFLSQWQAVRWAAGERGIRILGDLPIYVSWNSAEVWTRRELFELDETGRPLAVAGVPPDYFSETGQLWGNPLFRWERMAEDGYAWWVERLRANLRLTDLVRLDHFRGFASYWRVPAGEETAVNGAWVPGPRTALFDAFRNALRDLPPVAELLVAEDLGELTPDVGELLDAVGLPSMRVLQFGLEDATSVHAPHHLPRHCLAYTGTHDNDTTAGWFWTLGEEAQQRVVDYLGVHTGDLPLNAYDGAVAEAMIRTLYSSVARRVVVPIQDVLALGSKARMNTPGEPDGHWAWRLTPDLLRPEHAERLRRLAELTDRARHNHP